MSRCILVVSTLCLVAVREAAALTAKHPMLSSITQQSSVLSLPLESSRTLPVPTASRCIVMMCCQFIVAYTALALCRTYHELTSTAKGRLEGALRASAQTLTYGPMLCVLFIACHMRVEYLSNGTDQPQAWVQRCMYALTSAVLASALLTLTIQLVTGKALPPKVGPFDLEMEMPRQEDEYSKLVFCLLTFVRYMLLFAIYGGLAGIIFGMCTYMPPGAKTLSEVEAPAPAVMCTMVLAIVFFGTQFIIAACRTYSELTRVELPQIVGMMHAASTTMEFAPMLAVLFLAARMRALQHDAQPQEWAQACMFASTGAICVMSLLAIMVPVTLGGTLKTNPWTHEVIMEVPSPTLGYIFIGARYICMLCLYGCAVGVIISIFVFESPGPMETLPVSPTVQCVVNLTCQFFFVYFLMTGMLTVSEITGGRIAMEQWSMFSAVESARSTLSFAPMLSILFMTTRMYALVITDNKGAPPAWVQDAMYMATWSLQISGLMCLGTGFGMAKVKTEFDGNVVNKFTNRYVGMLVVAIRYTSMMLLYGGMILVIVGLFTMTAETANGHGSITPATDSARAMASASGASR